jgi:hypothetical protein
MIYEALSSILTRSKAQNVSQAIAWSMLLRIPSSRYAELRPGNSDVWSEQRGFSVLNLLDECGNHSSPTLPFMDICIASILLFTIFGEPFQLYKTSMGIEHQAIYSSGR